MNFFFGFKNDIFESNLSIPIFNNKGKIDNNLSLFSAKPIDNEWEISKINLKLKDNFFLLKNELIRNNENYFLAKETEVKKKMNELKKKLIEVNDFTKTSPVAYRCNLKIKLINGGSSSYQSDYPYSMIIRKGNILSPIMNLLSENADYNYILFRNIYFLPIHESSKIYFVDVDKKEILSEILIKSNISNLVEINKKFLKKSVYLFSENFLGIPIYISVKNKHLSIEHTHPPHHYILSGDKFNVINKFKNKIRKIINSNV